MKLQLLGTDKTAEIKDFDKNLLNTEEYIKYTEYMKYESCFLLRVNDKKYLVTLDNGECLICLIDNDFIEYLTKNGVNVQDYFIDAFMHENKLYCIDKMNNKFVFDTTLSIYESGIDEVDKYFEAMANS